MNIASLGFNLTHPDLFSVETDSLKDERIDGTNSSFLQFLNVLFSPILFLNFTSFSFLSVVSSEISSASVKKKGSTGMPLLVAKSYSISVNDFP